MIEKNLEKMANEAFANSVKWILQEFGPISDLPETVIPVIWVRVYKAMEVGKAYELGIVLFEQADLKKDKLSQTVLMMSKLEKSTLTLNFIKKMVPIIRESKSVEMRLADSQLFIDILKWNIINAGTMPEWKRYIARLMAKPDIMYSKQVPSEILYL